MKTLSGGLLLITSLLLVAGLAIVPQLGLAQAKLYRWVDENGEVHFSESLPPDFKNDKNELQKRRGIGWEQDKTLQPPPPPSAKPRDKNELPRDSSGLKRPAPRYTPAQLKVQQDALLLLRYDSEKEIIDAMQVEIKQLDYDRRVLHTSRSSLAEAYRGNIREAAERQRAGVKVEDKLINEVRRLKQRLASNQQSLAGLRIREASIRQMFEAELSRYRSLVTVQDQTQKER